MFTLRMLNRIVILFVCFFLSFVVQAQGVTGSGAAFPSSVYTLWASSYTKETGQPVIYKATNAIDGAKRMISREIDFGATQPALSRSELTRHGLIQIPTMVGAIVPVLNLPNVPVGALRLTGDVLAEIYTGNIKRWDDPKIAQINPQLRLPAMSIVRIVRENGAGITDAFTRYLSVSSPSWAKSFGSGNEIAWRGDVTTGKGNDGVIKALEKTVGAIGYVSYDRVKIDRLNFVPLKNRSGRYVVPSESALKAGLFLSTMFSEGDETASLINLSGEDVWPILDATFILIDARPATASKVNATLQFLYWAFLKGDPLVQGTGFVPLPALIQARAIRYISDVRPRDGGHLDFVR